MTAEITQIPLKESLLSDPFTNEIEYLAWERADTLVHSKLLHPVSEKIVNYYHFGYYLGEVSNGGHSQLVHNMDIDFKRSPKLIEGFTATCTEIGAPEFIEIAQDFQKWLLENPAIAQEQTGFLGGRAQHLDDLDNKFVELNESLQSRFVELDWECKSSCEMEFLNDCIGRKGNWNGDINALEAIWLFRSGIVKPIADEIYQKTWNSLLS